MKFHRITVEVRMGATYGPDADFPFAVYGYGRYPRTSVLAGRESRVFLGSFRSVEAALDEYPKADVVDGSLYEPMNLDYLPDRNGVPYGDDVW